MNDVLAYVMHWLYGSLREARTYAITEIVADGEIDDFDVNSAMGALNSKDLVRMDTIERRVRPTPEGKQAWEEDSYLQIINGHRFILDQSRDAVMHVIVQDADGSEHGGSAVFVSDASNIMVTAAHVLRKDGVPRTIMRIEDHSGRVIANGDRTTWVSEKADLALIECPMPAEVRAPRIEWQEDRVMPLDQVLVLGYPPIPHHNAALFSGTGEVQMLPLDYQKARSIIFSTATRPGCSGGPVLGSRGRVLGIVCQEDTLELENALPATYYRATPAYYAADLFRRALATTGAPQ